MNYRQRIQKILFAALITMLIAYAFTTLTFGITIGFEQTFGYRLGILLSFLVSMLIMMAAGMPILLLEKIRKVPNMVGVTLFATAEAFWLAYLLIVLNVSVLVSRPVLPLGIVLIVVMYFAADALFNTWQAPLRYKIATSVAIVGITALLADRLISIF